MRRDGVTIQHAENGGEVRLPGIAGKVDGFDNANNTVYEYHGTHYHGDPRVCPPNEVNFLRIKYGDLYHRTLLKREVILKAGHKYVCVWQIDWLNGVDKSDLDTDINAENALRSMSHEQSSVVLEAWEADGALPSRTSADQRFASAAIWLIGVRKLNPSQGSPLHASITLLDEKVPGWRDPFALDRLQRTQHAIDWSKAAGRMPTYDADDDIERRHAVFLYNLRDTRDPVVTSILDRHMPKWKDRHSLKRFSNAGSYSATDHQMQMAIRTVAFFAENGRFPCTSKSTEEKSMGSWLTERRKTVHAGDAARCKDNVHVSAYLDTHLQGWRVPKMENALKKAKLLAEWVKAHKRLPAYNNPPVSEEYKLFKWLDGYRSARRGKGNIRIHANVVIQYLDEHVGTW